MDKKGFGTHIQRERVFVKWIKKVLSHKHARTHTHAHTQRQREREREREREEKCLLVYPSSSINIF